VHRTTIAAALAAGALFAAPALASAEDGTGTGTPSGPSAGKLAGRVLTLDTTVDSVADGLWGTTIDDVLSHSSRRARGLLEDQDAIVLISASARVTVDGEAVSGDARSAALAGVAVDDAVELRGKVLSSAKWREDEDGDPTLTLRAKRIDLVSDEAAAQEESDDSSTDEAASYDEGPGFGGGFWDDGPRGGGRPGRGGF
jgi:hypothetical protein